MGHAARVGQGGRGGPHWHEAKKRFDALQTEMKKKTRRPPGVLKNGGSCLLWVTAQFRSPSVLASSGTGKETRNPANHLAPVKKV